MKNKFKVVFNLLSWEEFEKLSDYLAKLRKEKS